MKNTKYVKARQEQIMLVRDQVLEVNDKISVADGQVVIEFLLNVAGFTMIPGKISFPATGKEIG